MMLSVRPSLRYSEIVAPRALEGEHRDRLAARHSTLAGGGGAGSSEERLERESDVPRAAEPALRRLREAVFEDAPELRRSGRIERRQPRRGVAQRGGHDLLRRPTREGTPGGQHLVQDAAEREQIAAGIGRQTLDLFGRHVPDRPEHDAGNRAQKRRGIFFGVRDDGGPPREAEVEDLGPLSDGQEDVFRLEVAMDDILAVRRGEAFGNRRRDLDRRAPRQRALEQAGSECLPFEELHHREQRVFGARELVDRHDPGVRQRGDGARLPLEPLTRLGIGRQVFGEHLDRDVPPEPRVERAIHDAHAAGAQRLDDLILAKEGTGLYGQDVWNPPQC